MIEANLGGRYTFAGTQLTVHRIGYGAMQLAGPGVFGPPKDRPAAVAVLRAAIEAGVDHIDTSDFYGPHVVNQVIKEALHPYAKNLVLVTKVSCRRGAKGEWIPAFSRDELTAAVHDNLRNLGVDALDVVNLRAMFSQHGPAEGSLEEPFTVLADLQRQGLIKHLGLSSVTSKQVADARKIAPVVCVQNLYNLAHRDDDALIDELVKAKIAYVPFFPLGGFTPLQSSTLNDVAKRLEVTPMQLAQAWLLHRAPDVLLIPGTSSLAHLKENLAIAKIELTPTTLKELDGIGASRADAPKH